MIKTLNDYVDEVAEQFPELKKLEVLRIMMYSWKMVLYYVGKGQDLTIRGKGFCAFIGKLFIDPLKNFENYKKRLARRLYWMFRRTKSRWDGYYYFALAESLYIDYLKLTRNKYKVFKNVMLYKLLDVVKVSESEKPYIFRVNEYFSYKFKRFYPELRTKNAELIIQRDPCKMKDILVTENKYKYIQ